MNSWMGRLPNTATLSRLATDVRCAVRTVCNLHGAKVGAGVFCYGRMLVPRREGIEIGAGVVFLGGPVPTELRCEPGARVAVGADTRFNYGVSIVSTQSVRVGARCMVGSMVFIRDDDGDRRGPVVIEDDVWIAHGATIEPGTTVGAGSVVATMAVVSGGVPPHSLVVGNPARCLPLSDGASLAPAARRTANDVAYVHPAGPSREAVRRAIVDWLDDTRHFGAASERLTHDGVVLRDEGLLDSLGVVELVQMLEARFGVTIDRNRAAERALTLAGVVDLVVRPCAPNVALVVGDVGAEPVHRADPQQRARSQLSDFAGFVSRRTGRAFADYAALHAFSVDELELFWALLLEWTGARTGGSPSPVCVGTGIEATRFFPSLRVSWPENVLARRAPADEAAAAIVGCDERGARAEVSRAELRRRVRAVAAALDARGVREGDRVAAVARNTIETVVACLAAASIGASWSTVAPDMGLEAAMARLGALDPKVLFVHRAAYLNGARREVPVSELAGRLSSLEAIVVLDPPSPADLAPPLPGVVGLFDLEREGGPLAPTDPDAPWPRFAFDHPLFVLFSSGTTGTPKCIVHGHGGTLLEHLKEHRLHCDLGPADRLLFQTTTGWMMWNWTVSAIATGAGVVLYDGSVSYPDRDSLLRVVARERVTVFGTSPAYLQYLVDAGVSDAPIQLAGVREVLSTGSVLPARLHRWAKEHLADAPLQSISGGTDILGCFVMGSPWTDTYAGESSCIGLGLDVRAWTDAGPERRGRGELVCVRPFASRPVCFLGDEDRARLRRAYFSQHEDAWTHGDLVEVTARGTVRVLGRCDGVLNIRGIRIGPSEIYDVLSTHVPEVTQALATDEEAPDEPGGKRLVLFVVLRRGAALDRSLAMHIKRELRDRASAAHVPAEVVEVDELPTTFSGKLSEAAMQDALAGRPVRNRTALRNPDAIDRAVQALHDARPAPRAADRAPNVLTRSGALDGVQDGRHEERAQHE